MYSKILICCKKLFSYTASCVTTPLSSAARNILFHSYNYLRRCSFDAIIAAGFIEVFIVDFIWLSFVFVVLVEFVVMVVVVVVNIDDLFVSLRLSALLLLCLFLLTNLFNYVWRGLLFC